MRTWRDGGKEGRKESERGRKGDGERERGKEGAREGDKERWREEERKDLVTLLIIGT